MDMRIERASEKDIEGINQLLLEVLMVHHNGRPDLFKGNARKYTNQQLLELLKDKDHPIFVALDEKDNVLGYAFCILQQHENDNILTDVKTLYIDDLCVGETMRGKHVGKQLYEYVIQYAKEIGCYNVTLNVWACNENAIRFYEKCGLKPQKYGMETIL